MTPRLPMRRNTRVRYCALRGLMAEVIQLMRFDCKHARAGLDRGFALATDLAEVFVGHRLQMAEDSLLQAAHERSRGSATSSPASA